MKYYYTLQNKRGGYVKIHPLGYCNSLSVGNRPQNALEELFDILHDDYLLCEYITN